MKINKQSFIKRWSVWWIVNKQEAKLTKVFERELDGLINDKQRLLKAMHFAHDLANFELNDDYFEHNYGIKVEKLNTEQAFAAYIEKNYKD